MLTCENKETNGTWWLIPETQKTYTLYSGWIFKHISDKQNFWKEKSQVSWIFIENKF